VQATTRGNPEPGAFSILIVDDDAGVRTMLARLLTAHGYRTREADGADAALLIARSDHIDLVVTDVVMPRRSGIELRRELTAINPTLPVILISGFSAEGPAKVAEVTPNTRFMQKPFAVDFLVSVIREMLRGSDHGSSALPSTGG
jgi:DNA-binding NtrC family response regulator